jgi:hypothetical protein
LYGTTFDYAQINAIYQALFNRDAEKAGLEYWYAKVADKTFTAAGAAIAILNGAQNADKTAIENKLAASAAFSAALDTAPEMIGYSGAAAAASARAFLSSVTTTAATAAAVDAAVASAVASKTAVSGQTFTLTTSLDVPSNTAGSDTYFGTDATFTTGDQINGGAGTDTLNLIFAAANAAVATATGVENLTVQNLHTAGVTTTLANFTNLNSITNVASTEALTFSNVAASVNTVNLTSISTAKDTAVTYVNSALTGTADAVTIGINGVTAAVTLTIDTATAGTANYETFNVSSTGANSTGKVSLAGTIQTGVTSQTVNVTGDKNVSLVVTDKMTTVNASTLTGTLKLDADATANYTVTGGTGADRVVMGSAWTASDKIKLGGGVDTIASSTATVNSTFAAVVNSKTGTAFNNEFEVLEYTGTGGYVLDASLITVPGATTFSTSGIISAAAGATHATTGVTGTKGIAISGAENTHTFSIEGNVTGGAGGAGATNGSGGTGGKGIEVVTTLDNATNVLNLTLKGVTITSGKGGALAGQGADGVGGMAIDATTIETINIVSTGATSTATNTFTGGTATGNGAAGTGLNVSANTVINISGANALNAGTVVSGNNPVAINADTLTGALTIGTGSGADSYVGGSGVNTLTTSGGADTFNISASTTKADTIALGVTSTSSTLLPKITGFTNAATTGDKLDIVNTATVRADVSAGTSTGVTNLTATISAGVVTFAGTALATAAFSDLVTAVFSTNILGTTQYNTAAFEFNGSTYIAQQNDTTATFLAGTDLIVQLVGVTGVAALSATASGANTVFIA